MTTYEEKEKALRLIDADKFKLACGCIDTSSLYAISKIIDNQPTAYDIDKVVKELDELKQYKLNIGDMFCDIQENGTNRHFVCLEDAIEIVKAGGKNEMQK